MSGVCGWIGYGQSVAENQQISESMAQALTRFDHSRSQIYVDENSSLAIAASEQQLHYFHKNDFIAQNVLGKTVIRYYTIAFTDIVRL